MPTPTIRVLKDSDELAAAAAHVIIHAASRAIRARGCFTIALSGGSTPEKTYQLLAQPENAQKIDWARWYVFFGDERFVPLDDPRSNYHLAARTLLSHVPLPSANIFAVPTDLPNAASAASAYSAMVAKFFKLTPTDAPPRLDLILLGLGDDGHTASLFPGKPSLQEKKLWFTGTSPGILPPPVDRITATFPLLNAGREVMFLVGGAGKAKILQAVLSAKTWQYPCNHVVPQDGVLLWALDAAAAAGLPHISGK